ncbi:MAG: DUF2779 domain-containing protein [Parcubacteria group bacterium]
MTQTSLSKTNYILYRECPKNAWLKVHKPDVYFATPLSPFELSIIETGNEVDLLARDLFPTGEFQRSFEHDGLLAITDILTKKDDGYHLYEVKATNDIDKKVHPYDLAFQVIVLEKSGIKLTSASIVHLNKEYVRKGDLEITKLFTITDLTEKVESIRPDVEADIDKAFKYLQEDKEPVGPCSCIYKGRSGHCTTSKYSNPDIPEYSVHDLSRIGLSKRKLTELIDSHIFSLDQVPKELELSDVQKNQLFTHLNDYVIQDLPEIKSQLDSLQFPLYFLDYETFPSAIPRFDDYSPYQQIPFQYSLHILNEPDGEPVHKDFLYVESGDPSRSFVDSLQSHIGGTGSVIVWHKDFECGRNRELGLRLPDAKSFFDGLEKRILDLEDIFKKQLYVHKDFRGSSSIKKILPVLVPELSYKELAIQEGGSAADAWNKLTTGGMNDSEKEASTEALREYCKLDTYAMYAIWRKLFELVSP